MRLYRFEQQIESPEKSDSFCSFTNPLISNTFDFITSLSIGTLLPMMEYIRLSSIVNLGTLEISEDPDRRVDPDTPSPVIDFDRVFRAWAAKAELGTAFQVLRSVRINILDSSLTTDILPHLNKFPALGIVYPGRILSPATKNGRKNRGKYISDYDFRSSRPLLPHGWKGVTIRGSKDGRMRNIVDSIEYLPAFNEEGKVSEIEFPSKYSVQPDFRLKMEKDAHNSLPTHFAGRLKERHCLHELLDLGLQQRLSDDSRQQILGVNTSPCATPDAHVLWPGNFLQEFHEEISTHEQLAEAVNRLQRAQEAAAPPKVNKDNHGLNYWELLHKPMAAFVVADHGKGPRFEDGENLLGNALDGGVGDLGPRGNLAFQRGPSSEECLRISGPKKESHTDDAWNGRYIPPSTRSDVSDEHSAQASIMDINARKPSKQQKQFRKARHSEKLDAEPELHGKDRLQGKPQISDDLSVKVPIIGEPVPPTTQDETWDLSNTPEHSSPSIESEVYHEGPCKRHSAEAFHKSPAPNEQCHNYNRDNASDSVSDSEASDASWESRLSDLLGEGMDIDAYARDILPCIIHDNADRTKPTFWNQRDSDRHPRYAQACAGGLKAAEWRLHGQDVVEGSESREPRDLEDGQRNLWTESYENIFGVPHPAAVEGVLADYGEQARCRIVWDKGDRGYSISTEKVRLQEFGMLGMIRLDADLKAVGMDAGPAILCVEENGEGLLKVESKAPVVSLRIGEPQKWWSEGQTVLVREDLPTEKEKWRAKRRKEQGNEEQKSWVKPPRRNKKEPEVRAKDKEAEKKRKREKFDESFWELTGMAPSKRRKDE